MLGLPKTSTLPAPYFLRTARLAFRCWTTDDFPLARELWGDAEVTRFFGGPFSDEQIRQRVEREIQRMKEYGFQYWPIYLLANDEHVGCCGLRLYQPPRGSEYPGNGVHELGFHLRPKFWGQGLAVEAARAVMDFAFGTLSAKGLSAGHHPENANSKKVLQKLGFHYTHDEYFPELRMKIPYYLRLSA